MAHYYLDSSVGSSGVGTSWVTAFKAISDVPSLGPDDILEISGGSTGNSQTYAVPASPGYWNAGTGSSGHPFIIQIGQDSAHNGTANFTPAAFQLLSGPTYFTFSGKYLTGADGISHFALSGFSNNQLFSNCNHCHLEYIDGSTGVANMGDLTAMLGVELNNLNMKMVDLSAASDHMSQFGFSGSTYSDNLIHDCTFLMPRNGPGFGADGFSLAGTGVEIYRCTFKGYNSAYAGFQHQDGIQAGGGNFFSIHDCQFIDLSNSAMYLESYQGPYQNIRVYNNRAMIQDSALNSGSPSGFICGINASYIGSTPCHQLNIVFANNMVIDYNTGNGTAGIAISNDFGVSADFVGCYLVNTLSVNGTTAVGIGGNATSTVSNNLFLTAAQAGTGGSKAFTSYTTYSAANDYTVASTSSPQYHAGLNMQGVFSFSDYAGNAWNNPPSEGPYEFSSATASGRSLSGKLTLSGKAS